MPSFTAITLLRAFWAIMAAFLAGVPYRLMHVHGFMGYNNRYVRYKERLLNMITTNTIVVSEAVKNSLIRQVGLSPEKIEVIYNGIDPKKFTSLPYKAHRQEAFITICSISRLYRTKGLKYLLVAARKVIDKFANLKLIIVGDGPAKDDLITFAQKLGISEHVEFTGKQLDIEEVLARTDIFVLPSYSEGLSIAVIEAMASGIPVIATSVGGIPELVTDRVSGILVPVYNAEAIAEAIVYLIENPRERQRMGENGKTVAQEKFDVMMMVQKIESLYGSCRNHRPTHE